MTTPGVHARPRAHAPGPDGQAAHRDDRGRHRHARAVQPGERVVRDRRPRSPPPTTCVPSWWRAVAVVDRSDPSPHLYTEFPEGSPSDLPNDHLHPAIEVEAAEGAAELVGDAAGRAARGRRRALPAVARARAAATWSTATRPSHRPSSRRRIDELECIRQAQAINERAMRSARVGRAAGRARDRPLGRVPARDRRARRDVEHRRPRVPGDAAARSPTARSASPASRCSRSRPRPRARGRRRAVDRHRHQPQRLRIRLRRDLDRRRRARRPRAFAVRRVARDRRPRARGHEAGRDRRRPRARRGRAPAGDRGSRTSTSRTGSAPTARRCRSSAPTAATEFDASIVLQPGMVLVFEPVVWEDGHGGHRSEEIVAITEDGYLWLSNRAELDGSRLA